MDWITVVADTVDEAREQVLDALGVPESEAEIEVLEEPRPGLFGRIRGEARVRARVTPVTPRAKADEARRRPARKKAKKTRAPRQSAPTRAEGAGEPSREASDDTPDKPERQPRDQSRRRSQRPEERKSMSDIALTDQEPVALRFLEGLLDAFDVDADVAVSPGEDEALEFAVTGPGEELGLLIGPRGSTLGSVQELLRTSVAQQLNGRLEGRLRVDVGGYRERRREALAEFSQKVAQQVLDTGKPVAMEPMSPPDRKVIHDTINEIDGVVTESEGEDRRRHVVVRPE